MRGTRLVLAGPSTRFSGWSIPSPSGALHGSTLIVCLMSVDAGETVDSRSLPQAKPSREPSRDKVFPEVGHRPLDSQGRWFWVYPTPRSHSPLVAERGRTLPRGTRRWPVACFSEVTPQYGSVHTFGVDPRNLLSVALHRERTASARRSGHAAAFQRPTPGARPRVTVSAQSIHPFHGVGTVPATCDRRSESLKRRSNNDV